MKIIVNELKPNEIIKAIRNMTNLSQKEFAQSLNKSRDSINNLENGRNNISLETLIDIAHKYHLNITIEEMK